MIEILFDDFPKQFVDYKLMCLLRDKALHLNNLDLPNHTERLE